LVEFLGGFGGFRLDFVGVDLRGDAVVEEQFAIDLDIEGVHTGAVGEAPRIHRPVVPGDPIVAGLGEQIPTGFEPAPDHIGRHRHVDLSGPHEAEPKLVEHVAADAVGAEGDRVREAGRVAVADRVVHVRPGVVHDRSGQAVVVGKVHAVDEQPVVGRMALQLLPGVRRSLGHVHVHAHAVALRELGRRRDRVVLAREGGVDADHAPTTLAQEPVVLGQAGRGALRAVPVGHAVGRVDPHAHVGEAGGDGRQRTLDRVGRLVMIDHGRAAVLQRLEGSESGRVEDDVQIERPIQPPPHELEDVHESLGRARGCWHAPGERRVDVMVRADETVGLVVGERTHGRSLQTVKVAARTSDAITAPMPSPARGSSR
jgi:hypothetical protein